MATGTVIEQMIIIFILILIGVYLNKKNIITEDTSRNLSKLIINVSNPALMLYSSLSGEERLSNSELITGFIMFILMYAVLIFLAYTLPPLMGIKKEDRYSYKMMTIFGNVGFIGIPLTLAVLGEKALIYVSICNLLFSLIIYTFGMTIMSDAAQSQHPEKANTNNNNSKKFKLPGWINIGTVTAIITIVLYISNITLPNIIMTTCSYIGRSTTFLSMLVLGVSVATMVPKNVFGNIKLYIFCIIRLIIVPVIMIRLFNIFTSDSLLINTITIMISISFGNMPLMFAKNFELKEDDISGGIILSTVLSVVTIPIVSLLVSNLFS